MYENVRVRRLGVCDDVAAPVLPAKAGIPLLSWCVEAKGWVPAFAGTTTWRLIAPSSLASVSTGLIFFP